MEKNITSCSWSRTPYINTVSPISVQSKSKKNKSRKAIEISTALEPAIVAGSKPDNCLDFDPAVGIISGVDLGVSLSVFSLGSDARFHKTKRRNKNIVWLPS